MFVLYHTEKQKNLMQNFSRKTFAMWRRFISSNVDW